MTRINQITSAEEAPEAARPFAESIAQILARGGQVEGRIAGTYSVLLHCPEMAERTAQIGAYVRFESPLPRAQRELATLVEAHEDNCELTWKAHVLQALGAGVAQETIDAVRNEGELGVLADEDAVLVRYLREILRTNRVSTETFSAAESLLGRAALVELTAVAGFYRMLACTLNAYEVDPPDLSHIHT